jgi:hypothetical protein
MQEDRFEIEVAGVPYEFAVRPHKSGGYELLYYSCANSLPESWHGYKDQQTAYSAAQKKADAMYVEEEGLSYPNERPGDWEYKISRV